MALWGPPGVVVSLIGGRKWGRGNSWGGLMLVRQIKGLRKRGLVVEVMREDVEKFGPGFVKCLLRVVRLPKPTGPKS